MQPYTLLNQVYSQGLPQEELVRVLQSAIRGEAHEVIGHDIKKCGTHVRDQMLKLVNWGKRGEDGSE
jgi:hypothetical protein